MTNEERQDAIEWLKGRPITMPGAKKMYDLAIEALEMYVPEMNAGDMISRQDAIDALCRGEGCGNICSRAIRAIPPVQQKHGKWKPRYYDVGADVYVEWACSECGYVRQKGREDGVDGEEPEAEFCEKCGVKMER